MSDTHRRHDRYTISRVPVSFMSITGAKTPLYRVIDTDTDGSLFYGVTRQSAIDHAARLNERDTTQEQP